MPTSFSIRPAYPDEADALSDLALQAKAFWGYPPAVLKTIHIVLTPEYIIQCPVHVIEHEGQVVGFYGLDAVNDSTIRLLYHYVASGSIHSGFGTHLWRHAITLAKDLGYRYLLIHSDPHAVAYYAGMGAVHIGDVESPDIPGRLVPQMRYTL